ncbi:MAG: glycosyltransferase family 2 protein [Bacteroidota bacterium]
MTITIFDLFNFLFLLFGVAVMTSYVVLGLLAAIEIHRYKKATSFVDYNILLTSDDAPTISIIAPAYNESATIIENIQSLLSLRYNKFRVIVVNDGSKDDTLQKVIAKYQMEQVSYYFDESIATQPVRSVYKPANRAFSNLIVVDKENGGKADALNVGLNIADSEFVACIDVDCMLAEDALLKMIKPFMENDQRPLIASGGPIEIANSCKIFKGKLVEANIPRRFLPRVQILEYMRAFLLGRMGWSRINGLLLISGAFGVFNRSIAVAAGGYNPKTVGEDMELVVRMRRYMEERKRKYRVKLIPEPLCWTEVPEDYKILGSQRNRWARGTIETLQLHRKLFFNPRYRLTGMVSIPYWVFFEWLAPLIEFTGILYFIFLLFFAQIYWLYFFSLLVTVYFFAIAFSAYSLIIEHLFFEKYTKFSHTLKLTAISLVEPFLHHPFVVWTSVKGNWTKLTKKNVKWGQMTRKGFASEKAN